MQGKCNSAPRSIHKEEIKKKKKKPDRHNQDGKITKALLVERNLKKLFLRKAKITPPLKTQIMLLLLALQQQHFNYSQRQPDYQDKAELQSALEI